MHKSRTFLSQFFILISISLLLFSCKPQTKETYLEDYKSFISDIRQNHESFDKNEWIKVEEQFNQYTGEFYDKYKNDFTWKEQLLLTKLQVEYNLYSVNDGATNLVKDLFKNDQFKQLKEKLSYYAENNMEKDINKLVEEVSQLGGEAQNTLIQLLDDLDIKVDIELEKKRK